jgi:hypothetical protein
VGEGIAKKAGLTLTRSSFTCKIVMCYLQTPLHQKGISMQATSENVELSTDNVERMREAYDRFKRVDLSFVDERLVRLKGMSPRDVKTARQEFDYLAAVVNVFPHRQIIPTKLGDEFWHEFLLYTREYAEWSSGHFPGFVHHLPGETPAPAVEFSRDAYRETFGLEVGELGASCHFMLI